MQQPNMVYINKIGGELNFTAEKGLSVGVFCFFIVVLQYLQP